MAPRAQISGLNQDVRRAVMGLDKRINEIEEGGGGSGPPLSDSNPKPTDPTTPAPGVVDQASRADHVHVSAGGGVTDHDDLTNVTSNQHHDELHVLDSHTDVSAAAPSAQQVLTWNDLLQQWEPSAPVASLGFVAFGYRFDDSLAPPVAAGDIQFNNADVTLVTEIYVHHLDSGNQDIELFLEYLNEGDWFNISERGDYQAHNASYDVAGTPVDDGDWWTIPVTYFSNVGVGFSNNQQINLVIRYDRVQAGGSGGFTYLSDTEPTGASDGETWWDTTSGQSWVYYDDGDSQQWVQFAPGSGGAVSESPLISEELPSDQTLYEGTIRVSRKGGVVTLNAQLSRATVGSFQPPVLFATLPAEYRPPNTTWINGVTWEGDLNNADAVRLTVNPSTGEVETETRMEQVLTISFDGTWLVD